MDRHKININRHKTKEVFKSGSAKRKMAKEKEKKNEEVLAKSRRMTDFITKRSATPSPSTSVQAAENNAVDDVVIENIDDQIIRNNLRQPENQKEANTEEEVPEIAEEVPGVAGALLDSAVAVFDPERSQVPPVPEISEEVPGVAGALIDSTEAVVGPEGAQVSACTNNDIGKWPAVLTSSDIDSFVKMGTRLLQNCDEDLFGRKSIKQSDMGKGCEKSFVRKCHTKLFLRKTRNGETIKRSWLCFSPSDGHVYCFVCKLFSPIRSQFSDGGFCDWKNAAARLIEHETSKLHLNAVIDYAGRTKRFGQIDQELNQQSERVAKYWREVLKRLISVIVFISERGLAFRGDNETIGSPRNGNYLGILELLAQYDEFLRGHLETHSNRGSGHTNYLSSTICEEVVNTIGKHVFDEIISRIKKCKYFSISLDSTPDEGHIDQLSLIFRYMEDVTPVERFLTFMPNQGHKAKDMFDGLCTFLRENNLDIKNCRGQSYDNASAMSGKYNGLQALVLKENSLAAWIPCAGHSLNLVLQAAAGCCIHALAFFNFLEEIFVYFTSSTNRYQTLTECLEHADTKKNLLVPKRTTTTRWSCRADATKALLRGYKEIQQALVKISEDMEDSGSSRVVALGLVLKMNKLETGLYAVFWDDILTQVNKTSDSLQNPKIDVNTAAALLKSLRSLIQGKRESFEEYELKAIELTGCEEYEVVSKRTRKANVRLTPLDCVQAPEVEQTPSDAFRTRSFITVIDELDGALTKRLQAYELIDTRFGFLNKLDILSNDEVIAASKSLVDIYNEDLDEELGNEFLQFRDFSNQFQNDLEKSERRVSKEKWMYQLMMENNVKDCFPNVEVVLRMYLSLMVTNCSAERSFSKLKLIKNRLRTSMSEDRLNFLALLSTQHDILRQVNHESIINAFIAQKIRRKPISKSD